MKDGLKYVEVTGWSHESRSGQFNWTGMLYILPASGDLSSADNFANSFDPDQDRNFVDPDLGPNCLTL